MDLAISIGLGGWIAVIVGALAFGVIVQWTTDSPATWEWALVAVAAVLGALFASEIVTAWRTIEPVWDGLALVPAVLGGLVIGAIVDLAFRALAGGSAAGRPMSA